MAKFLMLLFAEWQYHGRVMAGSRGGRSAAVEIS